VRQRIWGPPLGALVCLLCLLSAACGASTESKAPAASPSAPACRSLQFPYPKADVTLTAADSGRSASLRAGGLLEVDLLGSPSRRWGPINLTGSSLLALSTQAETPTVGTRLGEFCAVAAGHSALSASDGETNWSVGVDVSG
jgi:hypothetical protein